MTDKTAQRAEIRAALREYVELGLPIIPVCSHDHLGYSQYHIDKCRQAGKSPLIKGWQTREDTTMEHVTAWIKEFKNINIGLPLGHVSGFVGVDVDGSLGEILLEEMSDGEVPETWEFSTGAGRRLLYEIPLGMITKKYVNAAEGDHQECSILANGQQTVMPPSIHHTGRVYEWVQGRSPNDIDCAPAPKWLIDLVRDDNPRKPKAAAGTIDLTSDAPSYTKPEKAAKVEIKPILVTSETVGIEFMEYESLDIDLTPPDDDYVGKTTKSQEVEEEEDAVTTDELFQKISAGARDNQMTRIIGHFCAKFRNAGKDYIMFMAKNHNQQFCEPPLDDLAIEVKVNHFWETEQLKTAQYKANVTEQKNSFEAGKIARATINILESKGHVLKADKELNILWMTQKTHGPWVYYDLSGSADVFQTHIKGPLTEPELGGDPRWWSRKNFGEVASAIILLLREQGRVWASNAHNIDTQTAGAYKYIPLADGKLLNWQTGELLPWDPETHLTYVLPIQYDPAAKADKWQEKLDEWLPDKGAQKIMQEFVGYSLIPYMGFEKALMIIGEGANGKTLFLETIQGLLGYDVVDSINMKHLFSKFGQVDLFGKILNIANEAAADYLKGPNADDFKNLVSGGRVKADVKNKSALTFNNTAKFIFAANHLIKTSDKSEGWHRRVLIVPFEQDFSKSKVPKYEIMESLKAEYAGIFNWAVEGLNRLMAAKDFSYSESAAKKMQQAQYANDITEDFYAHCLEPTGQLEVDGKKVVKGTPTTLVHELFVMWCNYRENNTQRTKKVIMEYLEFKRKIPKVRLFKQDMLMGTQNKTICWAYTKISIKDEEFLEHIVDSLEIPIQSPIKDYAIKRLKDLEASRPMHTAHPDSVASNI